MNESVNWLEDGSPHSPRFNDRYHSSTGGIAQAVTVFLNGCELPERWRNKEKFLVLETGFGLGLNFLTTWAAWETDPQRCGQLHFVSVEAFPVKVDDIVKNARHCAFSAEVDSRWTERVRDLALELAHVWKNILPGVQTFSFAQGQVQLTLAVGDVNQVLPSLECEADAVFLDGFSPRVNPQMWSFATLQAVVRHCRPGTTLATYTVAKDVRLVLTQLGFAVEKCQGLPPKRDRLRAVLRAETDSSTSPPIPSSDTRLHQAMATQLRLCRGHGQVAPTMVVDTVPA
jgi:tRNA 5-methylaminomethyl-2-thiouridine biosynthesis bifunctional protein